MIKNGRLLALIPGRGGSKRLPNKNIRILNGKPLIAWSIEAGIRSGYVDDVVVSTDCEKISNIAKKYGADTPFKRPDKLADDYSSSSDVVLHALIELQKIGKTYDYVVLLQPTSPLRSYNIIDSAVKLLLGKDASAVVSVTDVPHPIEWTNTLPDDYLFDGFISRKNILTRSQDFERRYIINGAIYLAKVESFFQEKSFLLIPKTYALFMSREISVDIDNLEDFVIAETYMKSR